MEKRVLMLLTNSFRPDPRVYREALTLNEQNYHVEIFCLDKDQINKNQIIDGISITRFNVGKMNSKNPFDRFLKMKKFERHVLKYLRKQNETYYVIHCHDFDTLGLGRRIKRKKYGKKLIFDVHELTFGYRKMKFSVMINFILDSIVRINKKYVDFFILSSYERLILFSSRYNIPNSKIEVINNYPLIQREFTKKHVSNKIIFQYQGAIDKKRNLENIINAIFKSKDIQENILLRIFGNKNTLYSKKLQDFVSEKGLNDIISIEGYLDMKDLFKETEKTNVGLVPLALFHKNNKYPAPNKLYEYIAKKNIVICQNTFGIAPLVKEHKLGYICNFNNIQTIKDNFIRIIEMDKNNLYKNQEDNFQKHIETFHFEKEKLLNIYKKIQMLICLTYPAKAD